MCCQGASKTLGYINRRTIQGRGRYYRSNLPCKPSKIVWILLQQFIERTCLRVYEQWSVGNFSPKVADFGLAKLCNMDESHVSVTGYRGTPGYSAPEFLLHDFPISYKCDFYSFGMLLFEILGRRKNVRVGANATSSLEWFPSCVWDKYEKRELKELTNLCGIEEDKRERTQRLATIAFWCIQDCPQERPQMSAVVKMLEGEVEILPPLRPFSFVRCIKMNVINSSVSNSISTTSHETDSNWYKDTTAPIEFECEIQFEEII